MDGRNSRKMSGSAPMSRTAPTPVELLAGTRAGKAKVPTFRPPEAPHRHWGRSQLDVDGLEGWLVNFRLGCPLYPVCCSSVYCPCANTVHTSHFRPLLVGTRSLLACMRSRTLTGGPVDGTHISLRCKFCVAHRYRSKRGDPFCL